jgi:RNA polymerase sigma-70 factor (ECF subfamily)
MDTEIKQKRNRKKAEFKEDALVHLDSMYRTALRITRNAETARDLVQETFFRAYKYWDHLRKNSNCRAWLYKIMWNIFINDYRTRIRHPETINSDEMADNVLPENYSLRYLQSPEDVYQYKIINEEVREAIEELPSKYRLIVVLSLIENYSYSEIEVITGLQGGTVKSRLFRGRKMLQDSLREYARERGFVDKTHKLQPNFA